MNTRPILDSDTGPFVLSASFNAQSTCFSVALESGFRVYSSQTCEQKTARKFGGGIGCAEMLSTTSYIALVGGGKQPKFPQNKVCLEDTDWQLLNDTDIIYEVQIWNDATERVTTAVEFKTPVQRVRISQTHLIVVLLNKVSIYKMKIPLEKQADYETVNNPFGLCELGKDIVAFPGRTVGQVKLFDLKTSNVSIIPAHETPLRALAISKQGDLIATASEQGTLIRLWSFPSCTKLAELRRGVDPAAIFSLAFSPNGRTLAVTSDKSTLHVFDLTAAIAGAASNTDPKQHKWGMLSKIPLLPRHFSDTYSTASTKFEMGEEPTAWGPHAKSATMSAGIPGVPGGRPTKGLLGWLDDNTIVVLGAGQGPRWDRFVLGMVDGRTAFIDHQWKRYID
ncbi:similar to WD repeat domain phosphoinositide-interacting protein 3 [Plenodomus lingam JN3]|uniref:Similar to WD repeat domain phosphoinositide-interacting protein 3 n=1 Tax=Leptosphaeria maculans (strain JN3 / isolate v23.1.3 / race Av1-4-5-6-7-8) TaxID=985895 RepID=E5AD78_LEPMJ|nr:similar to WD repeat domain phosphoinositide-interacting protein 3 [Plenodomus lingam JN3]CBY02430.1 similar to WD repeat domain phosphoinositide-interacting protein 3 [Plenodomus lingam JN3]